MAIFNTPVIVFEISLYPFIEIGKNRNREIGIFLTIEIGIFLYLYENYNNDVWVMQ